MELRHLRYFVAVAEEMSFRKAAERLHISQPPLSQQIKQLEEEIGTDLFVREKRSIYLTEAGTIFLDKARDTLSQANQAIEIAREAATGKIGLLRIGFVSSSITGFLQDIVQKFKKKYPDVILEIKQSTHQRILKGIEDDSFDLGLIRLPLDHPDTMATHTYKDHPYIAVVPQNHILAKEKSVSVHDFCNDKLIIYPRRVSPIEYDQVISMFTDEGITQSIGQEAIEQHTILALVAAGLGFAIVPRIMEYYKIPGVKFIKLNGTRYTTTQAILSKKTPNATAQNFIDCL